MPLATELINGQAREHISSHDRGLFYGDGVFETIAVINGEIPFWSQHLSRLQRGCKRLKLDCPDEALLQAEISRLDIQRPQTILKLILTRGLGGRGYALPSSSEPTRILQIHPWPDLPHEYWARGVRVRMCQQRLARQPSLAGIKHLNRLEQVLARSEWQDATIQEGLLWDTHDCLVEAVSHNVFLVDGTQISTPDLQYCGVEGVMRDYVLSWLTTHGYDVSVRSINQDDLQRADAVFLCNSIHGIWPICDLDGNSYPENPIVCTLRDAVSQIIPYAQDC